MNKPLFAFWKYDKFPYVLGGTVTKMRNDGYVETVEFGVGYAFKPVKILPLEAGKQLLMQLNQLECDRETAVATVNKKFNDKLKSIIDF